MEPILSLRRLEYRRGGFTLAIDRLDLRAGGLYFLLGPNGAGKSTLLQILALLMAPDAGTIEFAGEPIRWQSRSLRQVRGRVTLVHQAPYLFDRTVFDNVAFGLRLRGVRGRQQEEEVAAALGAVGLEGFEARRARELSGGEAQRVALARALALRPRLLLLDEPTSGLHRETVPPIERLIDELRRGGTTVIVATHDPDQPLRLGGEALRLEEGRLVDEMSMVSDRLSPLPAARPHGLRRLVLVALNRAD